MCRLPLAPGSAGRCRVCPREGSCPWASPLMGAHPCAAAPTNPVPAGVPGALPGLGVPPGCSPNSVGCAPDALALGSQLWQSMPRVPCPGSCGQDEHCCGAEGAGGACAMGLLTPASPSSACTSTGMLPWPIPHATSFLLSQLPGIWLPGPGVPHPKGLLKMWLSHPDLGLGFAGTECQTPLSAGFALASPGCSSSLAHLAQQHGSCPQRIRSGARVGGPVPCVLCRKGVPVPPVVPAARVTGVVAGSPSAGGRAEIPGSWERRGRISSPCSRSNCSDGDVGQLPSFSQHGNE